MGGRIIHEESHEKPGEPVRREVWTILGRSFDVSWPADMDALLDSEETRRRFTKDEYMPYWAQPWPAAVLLTEAVLGGLDGSGRHAVELGCGVGLVSIAAAMKRWAITATDYDEQALEFAQRNAERSGVRLAGTQWLDYREPLAQPAFDLVLGSDLLYERRNIEPVSHWIASALLPGGCALLSDPNRSAADGFEEAVQRHGMSVQVQAVETVSPAGLLIRGRLWNVQRQVPCT